MLRIILLLLLFSPAVAADSLDRGDFVGEWRSNWPTTEGEVNVLTISNNLESTFTRKFSNEYPEQSYDAPPKLFNIVDDIAIIEFWDDTPALRYKLVLSGWKSQSTRRLFGTMYMYRDGKLFNGLPISLEGERQGAS